MHVGVVFMKKQDKQRKRNPCFYSHYSQPTAARKATSKKQAAPCPPPLTLFLIEAYDVTVIFVTSRGAKIQNFGAPEGDDLAAGVDGASQDGRVRI